ncbi:MULTISPECIES: hypothetical protein [Pseudomonas]|uniref:hypothetical protein n=1 Tax=Pseudomonas TaxID=286 RepID=UPI000F01E899|nr:MULTISPECIES: hypothetical protein [Pseudomonas]MBD8615533.1 hypothetical protein [Pseudomonas putida]MBD8681815.1 hypothetical protein [Pseudomonas sp. CFBP 13719]
MSSRLRWKLKPQEKGLTGLSKMGRSLILHDGVKTYAMVNPDRFGTWFWVAGWSSGVPHFNSYSEPVETADEAKEAALAYVQKHIASAV